MRIISRNLSIKAKLVIALTITFFGVAVVAEYLQFRSLRSDTIEVYGDQQYASTVRMARDIDEKFQDATQALVAVANAATQWSLGDAGDVRRRLAERGELYVRFDDVLLVDAGGRVVSDYPVVADRAGIDVSDRAFFRDVMASGRPVITEPLMSKVRREPIVQIVVPVGTGARPDAVLVGVVRLQKRNFLGMLADERIGPSGYWALLTRGASPVYVSHPDRTRLLQPRAPNAGEFVTRALGGSEGSGEGTNSAGVESVFSASILRTVPWVLVAASPTAEVLAPLAAAQTRLFAISLGAALAVTLFAWFAVSTMLAPLQRLEYSMSRLATRRGRFVPLEVHAQDEVGELTAAFNSLMQDRAVAERTQIESERRLRLIADNLPALVCYLDADLSVRFANRCYQDWFGLEPMAMVGRTQAELAGPDAARAEEASFTEALAGYSTTFERDMPTRGGVRVTRTTLFPHLDDEGRVVGIFRMTTDITRDKDAQAELAKIARADALTGLPNRRAFEELLPKAMARARRQKQPMAVLFIDLDHFKAANDTLGHEGGDEILVEVARRFTATVRASDTVSRLGGDEFTVILEALHAEKDVERVAAALVECLALPIATSKGRWQVGASVGISVMGEGEVTAADLLREADSAAYTAKRAGRGRFQVARPPSPDP